MGKMAIKIALAGNPNCGKTTLFNALTGSNQFVGNWPGVTPLANVRLSDLNQWGLLLATFASRYLYHFPLLGYRVISFLPAAHCSLR